MMKKKFFLIVLWAIIAGTSIIIAQEQIPTASFESESHDFGLIKESDGPATFKFIFTNTGGSPLILKNVTASCGCTTPNWSKDPVIPGAKGFINVTYNPQGRPGKFEKQITITSNADPETQALFIKGEVIPKAPTMEEQYPNNLEGLRLKSFEFELGSISPNKKALKSIEGFNSTDQPLKVTFIGVPRYINIKMIPEIIKPKGKAEIQIEYDAAARKDWGPIREYITLNINDLDSKLNKKLSVHATIKEDFSQLTEDQKKNAPKIVFENLNYEFEKVKSGEKVEHEFTFKNDGKSDLIIRKLSPSCGCTIANLKSNIIKPGESSSVGIVFNSTGRKGHQNKQVTVITNDPMNTELVLKISGDIE
jgi:hypothetical protein